MRHCNLCLFPTDARRRSWGLGWLGLVRHFCSLHFSAGCGFDRGNGPDFAAMSKQIGPPRPGQARIVVMRELSTGGPIDPGWEVELDAAPMGSMKAGRTSMPTVPPAVTN